MLQTQCIAIGDGVDYEKNEHNSVLDGKNLPQECSRIDLQNPKMWRKKSGFTVKVIKIHQQYGYNILSYDFYLWWCQMCGHVGFRRKRVYIKSTNLSENLENDVALAVGNIVEEKNIQTSKCSNWLRRR